VEGIVVFTKCFLQTGTASIWIINKTKPKPKKGKVTIIDASSDYKEGKTKMSYYQNTLLKESYDGATDILINAYCFY
jgi:type I restriction enzyme M protein